MGILAERLREESKKDNNFIVGSEIREALQEVEQENSELRAQLARCVELIINSSPVIWTREGRIEEAGAWTNQAIKLIEDADLKRAKADAKVLLCAEDVTQWDFEHFIKDDGGYSRSFLANLLSLEDAVRAAKEER